jgi:prepilin-type N-terminal cleavage/methylation domain-containing protein
MKLTPKANGFTLVELLVAMTITAILAALMLTVTAHVLALWRRAQDNFTTSSQATLVLDYLERDLQAAIFRDGEGACLAVDILDSPDVLISHGWLTATAMKPSGGESRRLLPAGTGGTGPAIADARFGLSGAWLRFISTNVETRDSSRPGGGGAMPVAVSYQLVRRPVSGEVRVDPAAAVRYTLFRSAVTAASTFSTGYNVMASGYDSSSPHPPVARSARSLTNPSTGGDAIATNVVDFGIWLYARDGAGGLTRLFPTDDADLSHVADTRDHFPAVAEVMVRILTEEGAKIIAAIERNDGAITRPAGYATDAEWWWAEVEANSRVVVRRIEVEGETR